MIDKRRLKVRDTLLYRLRKKGIRVNTRTREIECGYGEDISGIIQVIRLRKEFYFNIQLILK